MSWHFEWDDPFFRQDDYVADDRFERWTDELLRRFGESPEGQALPDLGPAQGPVYPSCALGKRA
jgi:hypothetical protein